MHQLSSKLVFSLFALMLLGFSATTTYADGIMLLGSDPQHPCGVGRGCGDARAPHVLSIQKHTNASGSVGRSTSSPNQDVRTGDWTRGSNTQTISLTDIGVMQASDLRIYFNIIEPNGGKKSDITLNTLILSAFNESGAKAFSAALLDGPLSFQQIGNGQGTSDYAFGLDVVAAARLQAVIMANQNLRLGLSASVARAEGGPESFFIGGESSPAPAPVPEPATMILLGTGLASIGGMIRKRRQAQTE